MKKFIDLDVSYGDAKNNGEFSAMLDNATEQFNVTHAINIWDGPAGGNPEVRFEGTQENLLKFMLEWYFGGDERIDLFGMPEDTNDWFEDVKQ